MATVHFRDIAKTAILNAMVTDITANGPVLINSFELSI